MGQCWPPSVPTWPNKLQNTKQFLDYAASNGNAMLTYGASDMVVAIHSDASYLNEKQAQSRAGGHFFLSNTDVFPPNNGVVLNTTQIIKAVMSSIAEAELRSAFHQCETSCTHAPNPIWTGAPPTLDAHHNSMMFGMVTIKIIPKAAKAMDIGYH